MTLLPLHLLVNLQIFTINLCRTVLFHQHHHHHVRLLEVVKSNQHRAVEQYNSLIVDQYTVIHNYGNPYEKWNIFVAMPHLWLQLGMVKHEIMLCETVLNSSTLNTLTYLRTFLISQNVKLN